MNDKKDDADDKRNIAESDKGNKAEDDEELMSG